MDKLVLVGVAAACALATLNADANAQATAQADPVPTPPSSARRPTAIIFPEKGPNGLSDLPLGVHRIPDSNIVISGHQKGGAIGLLFGPVGTLVQSSANAEAGTGRVQNVQDSLRFDVAAKAAEMTATIAASEKYRPFYTLSPQGSSTLTVVPYVVITFEGENQIRPYVVLKTKLNVGPPDTSAKTIKYFCCEGKSLPLTGDNGLAENDGAGLKKLLASELETAINVMLADRSQPYPRDDQAKIATNGYLPFVGKPLKWRGYDLGKYNDYSLIEFRGGAIVFSGVNIAEPAAVEITPVVKK